MKITTIDTIIQSANQTQKAKESWHFHILAPNCQLNSQKQFALIFENTDTHESLVHYSDKPLMDVGKQLVQLLHGQDVVPDKNQILPAPSTSIQPILTKAKQFSKQGQFWHHHLFFPACQFNPHPGKWTICLEDQKSGGVLESIYNNEPKADLKHLESLFYGQKKA